MSRPVISRRCLTCGATVRGEANFCPQCGQAIQARAASKRTTERARNVSSQAASASRTLFVEEEPTSARERALDLLEETTDDPGLRFTVIALFFFLLFLVLLLLSKVFA
ncbi:MAG: hypothetical protein C4334_04750 [Pyrinomonas sp.]|uniref:zinc ribbon domain-containing protein n=1 Tax=Pyrinomonas sp. TaxID=2080306 RepID=UPI00332B878A